MLLNEKESVITSNLDEGHQFSIQNNAKMFEILSDKIYTYKIAAVVREITANAYDSHLAIGKEEPIRVSIPNNLNPYFEVEDFGIGMTEKEVVEIFSMYGASTKAGSNTMIGAFGIGAKTPFAYTNNFTIRSRKDGEEVLFDAYIKNGIPFMSMINKRPTDKENGTLVKIPVQENDFYAFKNDVSFICSWYKIRPIVEGVDGFQFDFEDSFAEKIEEDGYVVVKYTENNVNSNLYRLQPRKNYAVMGGVCYPFTNHIFTHDSLERINLNSIAFIKFEIGEVDISASREGLSDDKKTTAAIDAKIQEIQANYIKDVQEELEKCESLIHAHYFLYKKFYVDHFGTMNEFGEEMNKCFSWRGQEFEYRRTVPSISTKTSGKLCKASFYYKPSFRRAVKRLYGFPLYNLFEKVRDDKIKIIYTTGKKIGFLSRMAKEEYPCIVLHQPNLEKRKLDRYVKMFKGIDVELIDAVNFETNYTSQRVSTQGSSGTPSTKESTYACGLEYEDKGHDLSYMYQTLVDLNEENLFYLDTNSSIERSGTTVYNVYENGANYGDGIMRLFCKLNEIESFKLLACSSRNIDKVKANGIRSFGEVFIEKFKEKLDDFIIPLHVFTESQLRYDSDGELCCTNFYSNKKLVKLTKLKNAGCELFDDILDQFCDPLFLNCGFYNNSTVYRNMSIFGEDDVVKKLDDAVKDFEIKVQEKINAYPILKIISTDNMEEEENLDIILNYLSAKI